MGVKIASKLSRRHARSSAWQSAAGICAFYLTRLGGVVDQTGLVQQTMLQPTVRCRRAALALMRDFQRTLNVDGRKDLRYGRSSPRRFRLLLPVSMWLGIRCYPTDMTAPDNTSLPLSRYY